ncbi:hypothetical protein [uncultured Paraglaciecola sp.]|uniref:hypothetical protein n=1 Tax=uncultured Paraglaciecola sp. TaxID=1765024 RepID=UPI0030D9DBAB|tara:strand:+ start:64165 stop:64413 length:249 start_codon:yes stop_codon:yes gene_type:complete
MSTTFSSKKVQTLNGCANSENIEKGISENVRASYNNVKEAIANHRIDGLPVNKALVAKLLVACKNNESLDFEQLINEFVNNN